MNATLFYIKTMLLQPWDAAKTYSIRKARADAMAGLTVAVVAVPQSMAYALIAGVAPVYGLYTVIIQCLIGSLFNSNKYLSVGPINTQSLLVASIVSRLVEPGDTALYLQLVVALTVMKGVFQMMLAAARLGNIVRYVSQSVILGFTAGAGVLIAAGQLNNLMGFSVTRSVDDLPGLIGIVQRLTPHTHEVDTMALLVGLGALVVVIVCRCISRMAPGPLLAVGFAAVAAYLLGWSGDDQRIIGTLPTDLGELLVLPKFDSYQQFESLISGAMALSLLGLMEAYSIGKSLAAKTGQRISANQELLSQGFTNFLSAFFHCIPGSGSFSRSALNHYAGAKTLYAGVFNSLFVAIIFLLFAGPAGYIPKASLAAVLFVIAYGLVDWREFLRICRSNRADAVVFGATFFSTLCLPLAYAVFVGVGLNIALYMRRASKLHVAEMVRTPGGPFLEKPIRSRTGDQAVVFLQFEGDLFFGVGDELSERLNDLVNRPVRVVVMRLKRTLSVDSTVLAVLDHFAREMRERDKHVVLCGMREDLTKCFDQYGLSDVIGEENIFPTTFGVFTSAKQALRRAQQLLKHSLDARDLPDDLEDDQGWAYQI